jgi:DNA-directed RNA polymerase sigma subunit (sigma70/sigma32)
MIPNETDQGLSEQRRQEIFLELVNAQDQDMSVAQSRRFVAERFEVSEQQVRQIEREGLDQNWPPLS